MQLQQGVVNPPGSKQPPQPQVQTAIVTDSKAHSRSSSHASHTSTTSNPSAATLSNSTSNAPVPNIPET